MMMIVLLLRVCLDVPRTTCTCSGTGRIGSFKLWVGSGQIQKFWPVSICAFITSH